MGERVLLVWVFFNDIAMYVPTASGIATFCCIKGNDFDS